MKMTPDGKKRKQRPVAAGKQEQDDGDIRIRSKSKKKSKKKKEAKKQKTYNEGSANGISKDSKVVTKASSSMPLMDSIFGGSNTTSSIPLMDSIFGGSNTSSDDRTKNTAIGTKASSSMLDLIFDNGNSISTSTKKAPSATMSLFDNPKITTATPNHNRQPVPRKQKTPPKAKSAVAAATDTNYNKDDAGKIRQTLRNRTFRSHNRPLLRKALDFPGVFTNEEEDEENGCFLLDDENERTKETADAVRDHGFCVLRNVIDTDTDNSNNDDSSGNGDAPHPLRDVVLPAVKNLQRRLNKALNARGIHYSTDTFRFREGASRCKGRTDVVFDAFQKDEKTMIDAKQSILRNPKIFPVIQNLLGGAASSGDDDDDVKLVYAGLIFSYPGSCDQPWHQDGMPLFPELPQKQSALLQSTLPPYALNVFLPLEDEDGSTEKGPTELLPGSHRWTSPDERLGSIVENINDEENEEESDTGDASGSSDDDDDIIHDGKSIIAPVLKQGDALIYDYRVCHRGTANLFGKLEAATNHSEPTNTNADTIHSRKKHGKKKKAKKDSENDIDGTRRILYLMYARPWFTDHVNFDYTKNAKSLWDGDHTSADKK